MATKPLPPKIECMQILTRLQTYIVIQDFHQGSPNPKTPIEDESHRILQARGNFHINNLQNALQMQNHSNSHKFKGIVTSMVCQDTRSYATQWNTCKSKAIHFESQEL